MARHGWLLLLASVLLAACAPRSEGTEPGDCTDRADNDGDGAFDCLDPGCKGSPDCVLEGAAPEPVAEAPALPATTPAEPAAPTPPPPPAADAPGEVPATTTANAAPRANKLLIDFTEEQHPIPTFIGALHAAEARKVAMSAGKYDPECATVEFLYALRGNFSRAGELGLMYVFSTFRCDSARADRGLHFVRQAPTGGMVDAGRADIPDEVVHVEDLNGDGLDEVIGASDWMGQGYHTSVAQIGTFSSGRWTVLQALGTVAEDACGALAKGAKQEGAVFFQTHRDLSTLTGKQYEQPCGAKKEWRFVRDLEIAR